ncbi:unnamed protein product [Urochloa humidicola]
MALLPSSPPDPGPHDRPSPSATPAPVTTPSSSSAATPAPSTSPCHSPLSTVAEPFLPSGTPDGRGKQLRWRDGDLLSDDEDEDEEGETSPPRASYRDVLLRPAPTAAGASSSAATPPSPPIRPSMPVHDRLGPRWRLALAAATRNGAAARRG